MWGDVSQAEKKRRFRRGVRLKKKVGIEPSTGKKRNSSPSHYCRNGGPARGPKGGDEFLKGELNVVM